MSVSKKCFLYSLCDGSSGFAGLLILLAEVDEAVAEPAQLAQAVERDGRGVLLVDHDLEHIHQAFIGRH